MKDFFSSKGFVKPEKVAVSLRFCFNLQLMGLLLSFCFITIALLTVWVIYNRCYIDISAIVMQCEKL